MYLNEIPWIETPVQGVRHNDQLLYLLAASVRNPARSKSMKGIQKLNAYLKPRKSKRVKRKHVLKNIHNIKLYERYILFSSVRVIFMCTRHSPS